MEYNKGKGWFLYKLPQSSYISYGEGEVKNGFVRGGFALAPFDSPDPSYIRTIECPLPQAIKSNEASKALPTLLDSLSTSSPLSANAPFKLDYTPFDYGRYAEAIDKIQTYLRKNNPEGKVVFSRRIKREEPIDPVKSFLALERTYPSAFVFCYYTPESGIWLGATPELLVEFQDRRLSTMAVAGTRPSQNSDTEPWDDKNIQEHEIVADFIMDTLRDFGIQPEKETRRTLKAGPVEHLQTRMRGITPADFKWEEFLCRLSPTPALCGSANRHEMGLISELEETPRYFYGGWCGPVGRDQFQLYVNLRSALIQPTEGGWEATLFSGGGITLKSEAESEWLETERKASTLLSVIK